MLLRLEIGSRPTGSRHGKCLQDPSPSLVYRRKSTLSGSTCLSPNKGENPPNPRLIHYTLRTYSGIFYSPNCTFFLLHKFFIISFPPKSIFFVCSVTGSFACFRICGEAMNIGRHLPCMFLVHRLNEPKGRVLNRKFEAFWRDCTFFLISSRAMNTCVLFHISDTHTEYTQLEEST